jgi:hypothetical protein
MHWHLFRNAGPHVTVEDGVYLKCIVHQYGDHGACTGQRYPPRHFRLSLTGPETPPSDATGAKAASCAHPQATNNKPTSLCPRGWFGLPTWCKAQQGPATNRQPSAAISRPAPQARAKEVAAAPMQAAALKPSQAHLVHLPARSQVDIMQLAGAQAPVHIPEPPPRCRMPAAPLCSQASSSRCWQSGWAARRRHLCCPPAGMARCG